MCFSLLSWLFLLLFWLFNWLSWGNCFRLCSLLCLFSLRGLVCLWVIFRFSLRCYNSCFSGIDRLWAGRICNCFCCLFFIRDWNPFQLLFLFILFSLLFGILLIFVLYLCFRNVFWNFIRFFLFSDLLCFIYALFHMSRLSFILILFLFFTFIFTLLLYFLLLLFFLFFLFYFLSFNLLLFLFIYLIFCALCLLFSLILDIISLFSLWIIFFLFLFFFIFLHFLLWLILSRWRILRIRWCCWLIVNLSFFSSRLLDWCREYPARLWGFLNYPLHIPYVLAI